MLHSVSNFWRSCCVFLLQVRGVFWIRECSWQGGTTGFALLQRGAALGSVPSALYHIPDHCPALELPSQEDQQCPEPDPVLALGVTSTENGCDCSFLTAPKEFGDLPSAGAHLWL